MFFSLLALALAGLALYVYTHENTQQSSASILREVWTGKCQLSCCESRDGNAHEAGSSSGPDPCACAPCPCGVLASVYRTCRPAGQAYRRIADTISDCFYIGLIMLAETFMYIQRVFQFGRSRERQAELVNTNVYESTENFHFNGDEPTEKVSNKTNKNITQHESVSDANRRAIAMDESNVPFNDRDDTNEPNIEFGKNEIIGSVINDNIPGFIEASAAKADEESNAADAGCHKCLEKDDSCPILCLTKTALFVLISLFVLYLPLGDPNCSESDARRQTHRSSAIICFCDTYEYFLRSIYRITDIIENVIEIIICLVLDVLYESKLRFYSLLEKLDKHDLCAAACCQNTNIEESSEPVKEKDPVSVCPCIRRKCCKRRK